MKEMALKIHKAIVGFEEEFGKMPTHLCLGYKQAKLIAPFFCSKEDIINIKGARFMGLNLSVTKDDAFTLLRYG